MPPKKYHRWESRLVRAIGDGQRAPWAWSTHDPLAWALSVVDVMCSVPPVAVCNLAGPLAGAYSDEAGLLTYAAGRGWTTAEDAAREFFGEPLVQGWDASRGDVLYLPGEPGGFGTLLIHFDERGCTPRPEGGLRWIKERELRAGGMLGWKIEQAPLTADQFRQLCRAGFFAADWCRRCGYLS